MCQRLLCYSERVFCGRTFKISCWIYRGHFSICRLTNRITLMSVWTKSSEITSTALLVTFWNMSKAEWSALECRGRVQCEYCAWLPRWSAAEGFSVNTVPGYRAGVPRKGSVWILCLEFWPRAYLSWAWSYSWNGSGFISLRWTTELDS